MPLVDIDGTLSFTHHETGEGDDSKRSRPAPTGWVMRKKTASPYGMKLHHLYMLVAHTAPTLFINSGVASMHAGRDDFIKILNQRYNIYSEVKTFENAPHSFLSCSIPGFSQP